MTSDPLVPGIYEMPAEQYHGDPCPSPSLSSSIAHLLCAASPAHARQEHPRLTTLRTEHEAEHFDIGTAAHAVLLEGVAAVQVIDAPDWRTKKAREERDAARAVGLVPLLADRWHDVLAMVAAASGQLDRHRDGGAGMFRDGLPERTVIWQDDHGEWCRARLDWLRVTEQATAIDDYKTTSASANPEQWTRTMFDRGADLQAAWYLRGIERVTGVRATFRFAVQETFPPYALSVIALGPDALVLAEKKVLYALDQWRRCLDTDVWPTYPHQTCYATLPPWHEAAWLERELR